MLEDRHWWYRGRREIVGAVLDGLAIDTPREVLDAGCGSGRNLDLLERFGRVSAVDPNPAAIARAASRGRANVHRASLEELPFSDERFALVASLDVLEHVEDDQGALGELWRVTRGGGSLVLTVPSYPRLHSEHDEAAGHRRRYAMRDLLERARRAGWQPGFRTHFNSLLLPVAACWRLLARRRGQRGAPRSDLLRTPAMLNSPLAWPLRFEARLIRREVRLPVGLSILVVLHRS